MAIIDMDSFPGCCGYEFFTVSNIKPKDTWKSIREEMLLCTENVARVAVSISKENFEKLGGKPTRCDIVTDTGTHLLLNMFIRVESLRKEW